MSDDTLAGKFLHTISRQRWLFVYSALLVFVGIVLLVTVVPKPYESTAVLRMPSPPEMFDELEVATMLESGAVLDAVVKTHYPDETRRSFRDNHLEVEVIRKDVSANEWEVTPFIEIRTWAYTPTKAQQINQDIISSFRDYIRREYEQEIATFEARRGVIQKNVDDLSGRIDDIATSLRISSGAAPVFLQSAIGEYQRVLSEQRQQVVHLDQQLAKKRFFTIQSSPEVPQKSVLPSTAFLILAALILALMAASIVVVAKEAVTK